MPYHFEVALDVEATRDRFVSEFVRRQSGSVGLETGIAGMVDARRRFFIAIQGWEKNAWVRPFLTRLEGYFEKSPANRVTKVYFSRRGLALPITVLALLIPYGLARAVITKLPPTLFDIVAISIGFFMVIAVGLFFTFVERRVYKQLTAALLAAYDRPELHKPR